VSNKDKIKFEKFENKPGKKCNKAGNSSILITGKILEK